MKILRYCLLSLLATQAFSQESNDIARRSDFLNRSDYMRREFLLTRSDVQKQGGLHERFAALNVRMLTWARSWGNIKSLIENPPSTSLFAMEKLFGAELNKQLDFFADIELEMMRLKLDLDAVNARLSSLKPLDYRIEHYELGNQGQAALEKQIAELSAAVAAEAQDLGATIDRVNEAIVSLRIALSAKIAVIWSKKGIETLDVILRTLDEWKVSVALLEPLERSFLEALGSYQKSYSRDRLMAAVDYGRAFESKCQSAEKDINALAIADRYKEAEIERFKKTCASPLKAIALISKSPAKYMAGAIGKRKARIENICSSDQSFTMNCRLYSAVSGLSAEQIQAMPEENLRQLEAIYNAIESNKRRGNLF